MNINLLLFLGVALCRENVAPCAFVRQIYERKVLGASNVDRTQPHA